MNSKLLVSAEPVVASPDQDAVLEARYGGEIAAVTGVIALLDVTRNAIQSLLRRTSDIPLRDKTLAAVTRYFEAVLNMPQLQSADRLSKLKTFATEIIVIVIAERPLIAERARAADANAQETARRLADTSPEALSGKSPERMVELGKLAEQSADEPEQSEAITERAEQIVKPAGDYFAGANNVTAIRIITSSAPYVCQGFSDLFPEAMSYKLEQVTNFFQRSNPAVKRVLHRPFLLSPAFGARLSHVVRTIIAPEMQSRSRNIAIIGNSRGWAGASVVDFWEVVNANERFLTAIKTGWNSVWELCRQRPVEKPGANGKKVLIADPMLKEIRKQLAPQADEYTLPILRNPEIDLLTALAFEFDAAQMETQWGRLRQIYEQELDTRVYQDKARDGALRDSLLHTFSMLPDMVGDFMVILSYYCFPNLGLFFLNRFTHNKGRTVGERRAKVPYLMQFLDDPRLEQLMNEESRSRYDEE